MAAIDKLRNTQAIGQMLSGTHKSQNKTVVGFTPPDQFIVRQIGESWEELDMFGQVKCIWEQKDGYRIKHAPNYKAFEQLRIEMREYPNCFGLDCKTKTKTRLDERFRNIHGMCTDCVAKMETKLKIEGKYEAYEKEKMRGNAESFFKSSDVEIERLAQSIASGSGVAHSDGSIEKWLGDTGKADEILQEYQEFKKLALEKLNG